MDYIIAHIGADDGKKDICKASRHFGGLNSCSILEPVVKMYNLTGKTQYLEFAKYIVSTGFSLDGNFINLAREDRLKPYQYPHKKAYEMMSCFQGLLEYYKVVRDERHLIAVKNFFNAVTETDLTICGSSGCNGEMFNNSSITQTNPGIVTEWENGYMQETCVTTTWMNLCFTLLKFTGEAKYAEYIESSALNAMYGAINTENQTMKNAVGYDLDCTVYKQPHESFVFDSYSPLFNDKRGKGMGGFIPLQNGRAYGCCACIGSAGVAIAELYKIMKGDDGIYVNGFENYVLQTDYNGQQIKIKVIADLYKSATVKIIVSGGKFKLHIRAPKWSERFDISVDGANALSIRERGYAVLERDWQDTEINVYLSDSLKKIELNDKVAVKKGAIVDNKSSVASKNKNDGQDTVGDKVNANVSQVSVSKSNEKNKRKLYTTLAEVETSLEKYKAFEYFRDIQILYDSLAAGYKSAKNAIDANDFDTAIEISQELVAPRGKIDALIPIIQKYYRLKNIVENTRKQSVDSEASIYAKETFETAERCYANVKSAAEKKDFESALREVEGLANLYKRAQKEADENPASIYKKGLVAKQSGKYKESFSFFAQSAEKRYPPALTNLGLCYLKGEGVNKDERKAFDSFHEASKLNYAQAQYFLAGCYAKGIGVKYDKESARVWMAIAKVNGSKAAGDFLAKAGWVVSLDEERAISEVLQDGKLAEPVSGKLREALQSIIRYK